MAGIVNLRQKRKEAARKAARRAGDENAARFGETPAERARRAAEAGQTARRLDGHRREAEGGSPDPQDETP